MKSMRLLYLVTAIFVFWNAPAAAQTTSFPSSWEGIWNMTTTLKDCDTGTVLNTSTAPDTICAGQSFGSSEFVCNGTITDTSIDVTCTAISEVYPGCTVSITMVSTGTRSGNTFQGTTRLTSDYSPECGIPDTCMLQEISGTFVSPYQGECTNVAIADGSWGAMKARF